MTPLIAKPQKKNLRTSVVVPCCHKHVRLLPELLSYLDRQSRAPDEVIISLSGCDVPSLPPGVCVLHSAMPCTAGQNRNRGSDAAVGDLIIYQDADDVPHPQRIEIITNLFETYEVEHLMHGYIYTRDSRGPNSFPDETLPASLKEIAARCAYRPEPAPSTLVTNGEVAIARTVFRAVRWPEDAGAGEDLQFNRMVYARFKQTVTLELPLVIYRHEFSSFR